MMMTREAFLPAFTQTRHGRLFELLRDTDDRFRPAAKDPVPVAQDDAALMAFRDVALGSWAR